MKHLAVLGASGHGKVVADAALGSGWDAVTFFDDRWPGVSSVGPWTVVGDTTKLLQEGARFDGVVVAIGDNLTRLRRHRELCAGGVRPATVVHRAACVSALSSVGPGTVICAGAVVNPFTRLGAACIVNTSASVDHDCVLGDGVHVSPGARLGGNVQVGELSWIGIGAAVIPGMVIASRVIVGAGAVVIDNVVEGLVVVGVPARPRPC